MATVVDDQKSWEFVLDGKGVAIENINAEFSPLYIRKQCPLIDEIIENVWKEELKRSSRLYNASKFRLNGVIVKNNGLVVIQVGLTDFKENICTNHFQPIEQLYKYGVTQFSNKHACIADAIAVTSVIVTSDQFVIRIKRSNWVAAMKGMVDTPGGHAEPKVYKYILQMFKTLYSS